MLICYTIKIFVADSYVN